MTDQELVKKCLLRICGKLGCNTSGMTQRDYELLCGEIQESTGTLISVSTIKRLLNGEFSRLPQSATLNAISGFLGYKNWYDYKAAEVSSSAAVEAPFQKKYLHPVSKPANIRKWKLAGMVLSAIALVALAGFLTTSSKPVSHFEKAVFSVKRATNNDIPNTVVFNYNVDEVMADSFFIQQSWDVNRRVRIYKNNYTVTDIYYEPGYHLAKLIANDKIIKTFDVSIPTGGWFFYAREKGSRNNPEYIKTGTAVKNGALAIDMNDLAVNHLDPKNEKSYIYSLFPGKWEVSSDNYSLKARVRVKQVRNNSCNWLMCEVFCQRNFMYFKSGSTGCASEAMVQFGEKILSGKTNDLTSLGLDASQWMDVEIRVAGKQVSISLNNKNVFSTSYTSPCGYITGLGFISNGLCEVDSVDLRGLDGRAVYSNKF